MTTASTKIVGFALAIVLVFSALGYWVWQKHSGKDTFDNLSAALESSTTSNLEERGEVVPGTLMAHPLMIEEMRRRQYPGSQITVEETLPSRATYNQYRVSYLSEGLKIYALMTVPKGEKPATGWPVIVFNHGYIAPDVYRTTERYVAYVDAFARNGYIVFKSDYRGHDRSEGIAAGGYGAPDYTVDVMNAVAAVKAYPDADQNRIGMWGHSMGGYITLRSMVLAKDVKAGVIWAGVVANYQDLLTSWRRRPGLPTPSSPTPGASSSGMRRWREVLVETYGDPATNPTFWNAISSNYYLSDISGPIQLHHAKGDDSVPWEFSQTLDEQLKAVNKPVETFIYEGDDHNLSQNFTRAMTSTVEFFDRNVKGAE